jgi:hypothetical protein
MSHAAVGPSFSFNYTINPSHPAVIFFPNTCLPKEKEWISLPALQRIFRLYLIWLLTNVKGKLITLFPAQRPNTLSQLLL